MKYYFIGLVLLVSLVFAPTVLAKPSRPTKLASGSAALQSCLARESGLKQKMSQLTKFTNNMLRVFDTIATRVENFYLNKVIPAGHTVPNYSTLVSDIGAKRVVVQTDLAKAQTDVNGFSCAANDPKSEMVTFKNDMKKVKADLKDYRTSIRNLIVAVHGVATSSAELK